MFRSEAVLAAPNPLNANEVEFVPLNFKIIDIFLERARLNFSFDTLVPMDTPELLARRLIAHGLAGSAARPAFSSPLEAARGLLAVQGQTYPAGIRSLALRSSSSDEEVLAAVRAGQIVRSWPQRGTLHFLAAEDARWLARLLHPRVAPSQIARRGGLQLDDATAARAHEALVATLLAAGSGNPVPRKEIYAAFEEAGVDPAGGRGPHLLRFFGGQGDIVQGPKQGAQETFVLVDALGVEQAELEGEAALKELGARYASGHGPVAVADLAWWTMLTKAQARKALEGQWEVDGYFMAEWQEDVTPSELAAALELRLELPAFDEYLLGYADKSIIVDDELRKDVLTSNGLSWPWVMSGGIGVASLRKKDERGRKA